VKRPRSTRDLALHVLFGVESRGAYADKLADSLAERHGLDARERALLNELVKGTLRRRGTVDAVLRGFLRLELMSLPPWIRNALRLGAYQLLYLDRMPAHAAVSETVALARRYGHPGTAGLVNSVLRRMSEVPRQEHFARLEALSDPVARREAIASHPAWMLERWARQFSVEEAMTLAEANNRAARVGLRANRLRLDRKELLARLARHGLSAIASRWTDAHVVIEGEVDMSVLPLLERGDATVQDESETLVGLLVDPRPGERVLDLCAAPGGKTTHLAERMGDRGEVVAVEKNPARAAILGKNCERLGLRSVELRIEDAETMVPHSPFDRVLVDAPCSGLGVLARRADARWRKSPEGIRQMAEAQKRLLAAGAMAVRPGGTLVYSVCSFEPEETVQVVSWFAEHHPEFRLADGRRFLPPDVVTPEGFLLCLPHRHGTDGAFAARWERIA
jgi:16S rRNA (cytosine967-C5)-methyltransferase